MAEQPGDGGAAERRGGEVVSKALSGLSGIEVEVTVVLGDAEITLEEAADLGRDALLTLGGSASDPVNLCVNGRLIARGKLVVIDDSYGVQITELVKSSKSS